MSSGGGLTLTDREKRYHRRRQKKNYYTIETPLYGRIKGVKFSNIISQALHELEEEIRGVRNGRQKDILRSFSHGESPTTSFDVCEHAATQSDLQHCSMPAFLARGEEYGETPEEENLGDYL